MNSRMVSKCLVLSGLMAPFTASAQSLTVTVVNRQDQQQEYDYVASYYNSWLNTATTTGQHFKVHGATFTLELPDGRLTVVNCDSKFAERFAGPIGNRRSCRIPLVDTLQADFNGDKAKLTWSVSLDGKKMQQETYKILAVVDRPKTVSTGFGTPANASAPSTAEPALAPIPPPPPPPDVVSVREVAAMTPAPNQRDVAHSPDKPIEVVVSTPALAVSRPDPVPVPPLQPVQPQPVPPTATAPAQSSMPELIQTPGMSQVQFAQAIQSLAKKWKQMPEGYRARCTEAKTVPDLQRCIVTQQESFLRMNPGAKLETNPWLYALEGPEDSGTESK